MKIIQQIDEALMLIQQGKIIAYPTEAVYGLGCDPFNQEAVERLLELKQRTIAKGFILLIANWQQLELLITPLSDTVLKPVQETWPGHVTWIFPKAEILPYWLTGQHAGIAIRMSAHPIAHALCKNGPLISTSANLSGHDSANNEVELCQQFPMGVDAFFLGELGGAKQASVIYDVMSGEKLR